MYTARGQCGNPGEATQKVERHAFGTQQRTRSCAQVHQRLFGPYACAILYQQLHFDLRVKQTKGLCRNGEPGDYACLTCENGTAGLLPGGHSAKGREVGLCSIFA
jgi:hypothetical protein